MFKPLHQPRFGLLGGQERSYIGVDGCPRGWIAIAWDETTGCLEPLFVPSIRELIDAFPNAVIGIDMPIGLSPTGTRRCDIDARQMVGPNKGSSIFPPPIPAALDAVTYAEAARISRLLHPLGKSITQQTFGIFPKLREVRLAVTPELQSRVVEVHPEVCFVALAGQLLQHRKKDFAGYDERREHLERAFEVTLPDQFLMRRRVPWAAPDDVLDAMVGAWTARRFAEGRAERFPAVEERDELGLRMEMVY